MQILSHALRKSLATKRLSASGIVGIALRVIEQHTGIHYETGIIRSGVLTIRADRGDAMSIIHKKSTILAAIHHALQEAGYSTLIRDIKMPQK